MLNSLPEPYRCKLPKPKRLVALWILVFGILFLGLAAIKVNILPNFASKVDAAPVKKEVFGFAPFWTLNKLENVNWDLLTTFAYFSLPVGADGSIDKTSYEWQVFEGDKLGGLFKKAEDHGVKRVVTLTQMDAYTIEAFLADEGTWKTLANETVEVLNDKNLDGVNIDFEYIPANDYLKGRFSDFINYYSAYVKQRREAYITVSVLASSVRFNKIYDVEKLAKTTDGIFMMAYDFYYPGSEKVGPSAPLYGYNNGKGPFWYDVSTAVNDFLAVVGAEKIIMGVPYYGWNYPSANPKAKGERSAGEASFATTQEKVNGSALLTTTPLGGWDNDAMVSWRGYWDETGWHVVYMEDTKSLSLKYDFAKEKNLGGIGIWALGFDNGEEVLWQTLKEKFASPTPSKF